MGTSTLSLRLTTTISRSSTRDRRSMASTTASTRRSQEVVRATATHSTTTLSRVARREQRL